MGKSDMWVYKEEVEKTLKIAIFVLLLALYGSLLAHKIELPAADDLGRHLLNGKEIVHGNFAPLFANTYSYTEPEHSFINHHWLFGVVVYGVHAVVGWDGLVIFKILILLLAFSLLFVTALRKAPFWLVALFSIPTILILFQRTDLRPEIFSYLFIALFLYILMRLDTRPWDKWVYLLIPLQVVWVNAHIFFIIGPLLVAGFLGAKILTRESPESETRRLTILLFTLCVACLANPNSIPGALYPFNIFDSYGIQVSENLPITHIIQNYPPLDALPIRIFQISFFVLAMAFLLHALYKNVATQRDLFFYGALAGATSLGAYFVMRLLPLFALMFLPAISMSLAPAATSLREWVRHSTSFSRYLEHALAFIFIIILCFGMYLGTSGQLNTYRESGIGITSQSEASARFFREQGLTGPIFNDYDIGNYLSYYLYPHERVFVDGRPEAYSESFLANYESALENEDAWAEALRDYEFNSIFIYQYSNNPNIRTFLHRRIHDPTWALVYTDSYVMILVRNSAKNKGVIDSFHITKESAPGILKPLIESSDPELRLAAADTFSLLELPNEELATLTSVVDEWPHRGSVWMIMGKRTLLHDPQTAVQYLQKALAVGHVTAETYLYLAIARALLGENGLAEEALQAAKYINPEDVRIQEAVNRFF